MMVRCVVGAMTRALTPDIDAASCPPSPMATMGPAAAPDGAVRRLDLPSLTVRRPFDKHCLNLQLGGEWATTGSAQNDAVFHNINSRLHSSHVAELERACMEAELEQAR